MRVLVVEDSDTMANLITTICKKVGVEAYSVADGGKAVEVYNKIRPQLVISDLMLPGLTGPELMRKILITNPGQKVIYISGFSEMPRFREWLSREQQRGKDAVFIQKPFELAAFQRTIRSMLDLPSVD